MNENTSEGFSLVEVLIAMFLLAVLSLAVLPLLVGATRLSVANKDLVAATAFANAQVAILQDAFPIEPALPTSCDALQGREVNTGSPIFDPAGTGMAATVDVVDACPSQFPTSIAVTVTVRDDQNSVLVSVPTRLRVSTS